MIISAQLIVYWLLSLILYLKLYETESEVVCPCVHLRVEIFAHKAKKVEHNQLPYVADLISKVGIAQHSLLKKLILQTKAKILGCFNENHVELSSSSFN